MKSRTLTLSLSKGLAAALGCLIALTLSLPKGARATDVTNVSTPSGSTHGSLVNGNLPVANSANGVADSGIAKSNVGLLNGTNAWSGLNTDSGGLALPSPTNPTGSNFYIDSSNVLHFVNTLGDWPLVGAKFIGSNAVPWFQSNMGFGQVRTTDGTPQITADFYQWYNGGGAQQYSINHTGQQGKGFTSTTSNDQHVGDTSFTIAVNANIAAEQSVSGPGIAASTTVSSYSAGALIINNGLTVAIPHGTVLAFEGASNSSPTGPTTLYQCTLQQFTAQTSGQQDNTCINAYVQKYFPSRTISTGFNFNVFDDTGRESSVSGSDIGGECDVEASGPDDAESRFCLDVVASEAAPSGDGATTIDSLIRVRPSAAGRNSVNPITINKGVYCATMPGGAASGVYGSFRDCFLADGGESVGVYDILSRTLTFNTSGSASSGQPNLTFPLNTSVNVGQSVTGNANLPASATVSAVYQCAATNPLVGCSGATNETLVVLSGNLTGAVANATPITFTGVLNDGSNFNGIFADALVNWKSQGAAGVLKIGSNDSSGNIFDLKMFGNDSTSTSNIIYCEAKANITTNTHGSTLGEFNIGGGCGATIGSPTGGNEGAGSLNVAGTIYQNGVAVGSGSVGTTGSPASGNLTKFFGSATITNDDLSGDCATSGTLVVTCSGLAPKASPTLTGTVTFPDGSTVGAAWTMASAIAMGNHGLTGAGAYIGNNSSGPEVVGNAATSATTVSLIPNRASLTTGIGGASGQISLVAGGTEIERVTSSGIILESGAYFSGATSGVSCTGVTAGTVVVTNGIVTHC